MTAVNVTLGPCKHINTRRLSLIVRQHTSLTATHINSTLITSIQTSASLNLSAHITISQLHKLCMKIRILMHTLFSFYFVGAFF